MLPPDAQRLMSKRAGATVVEVKSSHAVYVSQPQAVAHLIEKAATGALEAANDKEPMTAAARYAYCVGNPPKLLPRGHADSWNQPAR